MRKPDPLADVVYMLALWSASRFNLKKKKENKKEIKHHHHQEQQQQQGQQQQQKSHYVSSWTENFFNGS